MVEIIPAILVKTREDLIEHISRVKGHVSSVHIDVMDNEFVPNITVGLADFESLPSGMYYEFHWMVNSPEKWIAKVKGKNLHVVHAESPMDWNAVIAECKKSGSKLGIAINPATPISMIDSKIKDVSRVLVMSVVPGFDGQKYIPDVEKKISELRAKYPKLDIEVDGGVGPATAGGASKAGANKLAAASAIYAKPDAGKAISEIRSVAEQ